MIVFDLVLQLSSQIDAAHLVQVAVDNAAAIKDLATAVYLLVKASKLSRKT